MIAGIVIGLFKLIFLLVGGVIGLLCSVFWLWMLIHAISNKNLTDGEKVVWVLVIIFLPFLGSVLYYFIGKPKGP
jgi:hypothetical protein